MKKMLENKFWQGYTIFLYGIWLLGWIFVDADFYVHSWNKFIVGIAAALLGFTFGSDKLKQGIFVFLAGIWLTLSGFFPAFNTGRFTAPNYFLVSAIFIIASLSALLNFEQLIYAFANRKRFGMAECHCRT